MYLFVVAAAAASAWLVSLSVNFWFMFACAGTARSQQSYFIWFYCTRAYLHRFLKQASNSIALFSNNNNQISKWINVHSAQCTHNKWFANYLTTHMKRFDFRLKLGIGKSSAQRSRDACTVNVQILKMCEFYLLLSFLSLIRHGYISHGSIVNYKWKKSKCNRSARCRSGKRHREKQAMK